MDLGDIVSYGGRRYYLRGLDPIGAQPRYVYLEDVRTRESMSVAFERVAMAERAPRGRLRLAREDKDDGSTRGDAGGLKR
jgi:hypothetical protein